MLTIRSYAAPISEPRLRGSAGTFTRNSVRPRLIKANRVTSPSTLVWSGTDRGARDTIESVPADRTGHCFDRGRTTVYQERAFS
jgi:hypothetical protein